MTFLNPLFFFFFLTTHKMIDCLPFEVIKNIGLYLNQADRKSCSTVSSSWYHIYQPLVFQKALFKSPKQLTSYLNQTPELKKLTQELHFDVSLTDNTLHEFVCSCPHVHTLTLFINLLNNLSVQKTWTLIRDSTWSKTLVKIRMDELILPKVLPLLHTQLEDLTGSWSSLIDSHGQLISMPKLKILDVDSDLDFKLTLPILNQIRVAYPNLKSLTASDFHLEETPDFGSVLTPFPHVRAFHLLNSYDNKNALPELMTMFTDLHAWSVLRSATSDLTKSREGLYKEMSIKHPNIRDLKLDYFNSISMYARYPQTRSLQLEGNPYINIVTYRSQLNLQKLVESLPHLRHLKFYGIIHLETENESIKHYLSNTAKSGYILSIPDLKKEDTVFMENNDNEYDTEIVEGTTYYAKWYPEDDQPFFGNGEIYLGTTRKKIMPSKPIWNIQPNLNVYTDELSPSSLTFLTTLSMEMVTLRNPTFQWLKQRCPMLEELVILKSEPYPYCVIELGPKLRVFSYSLDRRYVSFKLPIVCLNNTVSLEWVKGEFKETEYAKEMSQISNAYKIHINFSTSVLQKLKLFDHFVPKKLFLSQE